MSAGHTIGPDDLIDYKSLSNTDKDFEFATILTPGNRERHQFNSIQSLRWANKYNTNVIRWPRRIREKTWKGKPMNPLNVSRAKEDSCFWEVFVPTALAYLTVNLNMIKGLANGVPVKYHSLSFSDKDAHTTFQKMVESAEPGDTITLTQAPDFINIEIFPNFLDNDKYTKQHNVVKRNTQKHGLIQLDKRAIIPI